MANVGAIFIKPRYISTHKGTMFIKPRYVFRYALKPKPIVFTGPIPDSRIGVPMVDEPLSGPMPIFVPWIITNPTSIGFYCW